MADGISQTPPPVASSLRRGVSLALILVLILAGVIWLQGGDPVGTLRAPPPVASSLRGLGRGLGCPCESVSSTQARQARA